MIDPASPWIGVMLAYDLTLTYVRNGPEQFDLDEPVELLRGETVWVDVSGNGLVIEGYDRVTVVRGRWRRRG